VQTGNRKRDEHLRSADFFDAENHPRVRFLSDSVDLQGDTLKVRGRLSARGRSIPVELDAQVCTVDGEVEIEAATTAPHRELGMTWSPLGMVPPRKRADRQGLPDPQHGQGRLTQTSTFTALRPGCRSSL
jgi:polyisoprenoid-binding protein YceI